MWFCFDCYCCNHWSSWRLNAKKMEYPIIFIVRGFFKRRFIANQCWYQTCTSLKKWNKKRHEQTNRNIYITIYRWYSNSPSFTLKTSCPQHLHYTLPIHYITYFIAPYTFHIFLLYFTQLLCYIHILVSSCVHFVYEYIILNLCVGFDYVNFCFNMWVYHLGINKELLGLRCLEYYISKYTKQCHINSGTQFVSFTITSSICWKCLLMICPQNITVAYIIQQIHFRFMIYNLIMEAIPPLYTTKLQLS